MCTSKILHNNITCFFTLNGKKIFVCNLISFCNQQEEVNLVFSKLEIARNEERNLN